MKALIYALLFILSITLLALYPAKGGELQVELGTLAEDRIVDVRSCTDFAIVDDTFYQLKYLYCVNIMKICASEIVKNPMGKPFGYLAKIPDGVNADGTVKHKESLWLATANDIETRDLVCNSTVLDPMRKAFKELMLRLNFGGVEKQEA